MSINNTLFSVILVFIVYYINEATIFHTTVILALCYLELLLRGSRISVLFLIGQFYKNLLDVTMLYLIFSLWQQRRKVNIHAIITSFLSITFHQQLSLCLLNNDCQLTIVITNNICIVDGTNFTAIFSLNLQSKYLPLSLSIADR